MAHLRLHNVEGSDILSSMAGGRAVTVSLELMGVDGTQRLIAIVRLAHSAQAADAAFNAVARPDTSPYPAAFAEATPDSPPVVQAHAAARWANAIVPLVDCPRDPRTIALWSRWIAVSPGAVRNWCHTAGISARRSLVFGRLLRAVAVSNGGLHKPENVLDVVDRRTLLAMLRLAGMELDRALPATLEAFLARQSLVVDADALQEIRRALAEHQHGHTAVRPTPSPTIAPRPARRAAEPTARAAAR